MSKKKRRYSRKRRNRRKQVIDTTKDTHHLCFFRKNWDRGYAKQIRQFHYCMIEIPRGTIHRHIHSNMGGIPAPCNEAAKEAYEQLVFLDKFGALKDNDSLQKRLRVLIAIFDCIAQPTANGFKKQLDIVQSYKKEPP